MFIGFFTKRAIDVAATIRTTSGRLPVRLSAGAEGIVLMGVPAAAHPKDRAGIEADFNGACASNGWKNFKFQVDFAPFAQARAEASWLRSAYLAFFAACGYRFICRPEMNVVRERIADPNSRSFSCRIIRRESAPEPMLATIGSPEPFRSFAMVYDHHVVLLPRYGDDNLYDRLKQEASGDRQFKFEHVYSVPERPTFLHDTSPRKLSA